MTWEKFLFKRLDTNLLWSDDLEYSYFQEKPYKYS